MAGLDPRDPPSENRTVTIGYLTELYAKASRLRELEQAAAYALFEYRARLERLDYDLVEYRSPLDRSMVALRDLLNEEV